MADDDRYILYQDYTASSLSMIGKCILGEAWKLPSFIELMYPEQKKPDKTKEEIIQELLAKLGG